MARFPIGAWPGFRISLAAICLTTATACAHQEPEAPGLSPQSRRASLERAQTSRSSARENAKRIVMELTSRAKDGVNRGVVFAPRPPKPPTPPGPPPQYTLPPPPVPACDTDRYVGFRSTRGSCPSVDVDAPARPWAGLGWVSSGPFTGWAVTTPFATAGGDLALACVYTWHGPGKPALDELPPSSSIELEPACGGLRAQNAPDVAGLHDQLQERYLVGLGQPNWPSDLGVLPSVRVAVIDREPLLDAEAGDAPSLQHANAVTSAIEAMSCVAPGQCFAQLRHYAAIRRDGASLLDYALQVFAAVRDWQQEAPNLHLILNLSLGWDVMPTVDGPLDRLTHLVTKYARCAGALPITAAGNHRLGGKQGPAYPAAWESEPAGCEGAEFGSSYAPLVYAAGALSLDGLAQATSRPAGLPRLMATAGPVALVDPFANSYRRTPAVSGSSLAAAAISGMAATLWALRGDLDSSEVIDQLYASASPLGSQAHFALAQQPEEQTERRQPALCAAVQQACAGGEDQCDVLPVLPDCPASLPALSEQDVLAAYDGVELAENTEANPPGQVPELGPEPDGLGALRVGSGCTGCILNSLYFYGYLYSFQYGVAAQQHGPLGWLAIEQNAQQQQATIHDVYLELGDADGELHLIKLDVPADASFVVDIPQDLLPQDHVPKLARLTVITGGGTYVDEIVVVP